ncbi:hypothetical protein ACLOJK_003137 [Asimina triloba]
MAEQYSDCLTTETRKAWTRVKNPNISTISIWGWDGIGKSIIGNRIIEEAKKKQEPYFDVVILVSVSQPLDPFSDIGTTSLEKLYIDRLNANAPEMKFIRRMERLPVQERRRELQTKIMAELKLNAGQSHSAAITNRLSNWLARRRFLIMLTDVWEHIDLGKIGVPLTNPGNGSKVIIIPTSDTIHGYYSYADVILQQNFRSLSGDQAWQLLDAEARDAAAALSFYTNRITSTRILECFSYVSLFRHGTGIDRSSLKEFWRSEGFLDELSTRPRAAEEEADTVELMDALLAQLSKRRMLNSFIGSEFRTPDGVWELVSSRKGFLIQCDSSSQVPQSSQWEVAERISLSHNQIQKLPTEQLDIHSPPNCQRVLTLLLNDNKSLESISDDFFKNMTRLQVLDLSATGIKYLPSSILTDPHLPPPTSAPPRVIHQSPSCRRRHHDLFFRRVSFGLFKAHQSGIRAVDRPPPLPEKPLLKSQPLPPPLPSPEKKIDPAKQILILDRDVIPVVLDDLDHPNDGSPESATSTVRRRRRSTVAPVVPRSTVQIFPVLHRYVSATSSLRQQHSKRTVSVTSSAQSAHTGPIATSSAGPAFGGPHF